MNNMKTEEELQQIQDKLKSLQKEYDAHSKEQHIISEKMRKLQLDAINLPWEGKYIKYIDVFDSNPIYMKVDHIRQSPEKIDRKNPYSYTFKGFGFFGEFTGYDDATDFDWSYWFEFNITGNYTEFTKKVKKIEIITKEEFDEAFEKMLEVMKEYHYKIK